MTTPEEIDRLFRPIAMPVERFAATHGLIVEKCARGNQGWELISPHPEGGEHHLLLLYDNTLGLGIGAAWYFRCKKMDRIYYHMRPMTACPLEADKVIAALNAERAALAKVRFGYWTHMQPLSEAEPRAESEPDDGADGG